MIVTAPFGLMKGANEPFRPTESQTPSERTLVVGAAVINAPAKVPFGPPRRSASAGVCLSWGVHLMRGMTVFCT